MTEQKKYKIAFVNAGNPQLYLLGYFLAAMLNSNDEATTRVFGHGIRIQKRTGMWTVHSEPTNGLDVAVTEFNDFPETELATPERMALINDIWNKIRELNK